MPAFGRDGILKRDADRATVANYVRSLSGSPTDAGVDVAAGTKIFADNCAACHGDDGKGNREIGAPNLTDKIWLYGSEPTTIIDTHQQRPRRRDAGLGRQASTGDDQGARRLRPHAWAAGISRGRCHASTHTARRP